MKKPCDNCGVNIEQAILYDEITCYRTCRAWQEWRQVQDILGSCFVGTIDEVKILPGVALSPKAVLWAYRYAPSRFR